MTTAIGCIALPWPPASSSSSLSSSSLLLLLLLVLEAAAGNPYVNLCKCYFHCTYITLTSLIVVPEIFFIFSHKNSARKLVRAKIVKIGGCVIISAREN